MDPGSGAEPLGSRGWSQLRQLVDPSSGVEVPILALLAQDLNQDPGFSLPPKCQWHGLTFGGSRRINK